MQCHLTLTWIQLLIVFTNTLCIIMHCSNPYQMMACLFGLGPAAAVRSFVLTVKPWLSNRLFTRDDTEFANMHSLDQLENRWEHRVSTTQMWGFVTCTNC